MNKGIKTLKNIVLVLPFLLIIALVMISSIQVVIQSLGVIPAFGLTEVTLENYQAIFQKNTFLSSLMVSLRISFLSSVLSCILGVILVACMVKLKTKRDWVLYLVRLPILVPHGVVALFCILIFSQTGLFARILFNLGIISSQEALPNLLYTKGYWGVILSYLWKEIPFIAYFTYALMKSISNTLGEASRNLGASPLKAFFHVELPLSLPAILKSFLIIFIFSFGGYELPFLLGATVPKALPIEAHQAYYHPDLLLRPQAMAMYGVILLFSVIITLCYYLVMRVILKRIGGKS